MARQKNQSYMRGSRLGPTGDFEKFTGKNKLIRKIEILFGINEESHFEDPERGLSVYLYLFESLDQDTVSLIEEYVTLKIESYIEEVIIKNIESSWNSRSKTIIMNITLRDLSSTKDTNIELGLQDSKIISFEALN